MPVRAVLFDLDGVLVDSYEVWFALLRALTVELGYPELSREAFRAGWGQGIQADVATIFTRQTVAELERIYAERFTDHLSHLAVADGVVDTFAALRARGLATAVITNTPAVMARALVDRAGATPDVLVGGTDVENAKPAPDMVLLASAKLAVDAREAWVVGDTSYDRDAARAAGAGFAGLGIDGDVRLARLADLLPALDRVTMLDRRDG
jgi:phosphoglycolate phosphatase/AHBA synthesis associated protein